MRGQDMNRHREIGWLAALAVSLLLCASASQAVLVGYWPMDEGTGTTVVNAVRPGINNGTFASGGGQNWAVGKVGSGSVNITGTTSTAGFIDMGTVAVNDGLQLNAGGTISMWVSSNVAKQVQYARLIDKSDGPNAQNGYFVLVDDNNVNNNIAVRSFVAGAETTSATIDTAWHLLTFQLYGTPSRHLVYIDGQQVSTTLSQGGDLLPPNVATRLRLGYTGGGTYGQHWNGKLDDVAIWNSYLTASQINAVYSLANADLNYGAGNADRLFALSASNPTQTLGGLTWNYNANIDAFAGQTLVAGAVTTIGSNYYLKLNGGAGVTTAPEPATLALLVLAGFTTAARARRRC